MTVLETLRAAKRLIRNPKRWCKGAGAFDKNDDPVDPRDPVARRFCSWGAVHRCAPGLGPALVTEDVLNRVVKCGTAVGYNDTPRRRHSEVLKAFDRAIALAKREGL